MDPAHIEFDSQDSTHPLLRNSDILWKIFTLNADPNTTEPKLPTTASHYHYPLKTARYTSQVSRIWRANILNSPSVWANCVDIGAFEDSCDEWRQEVMTRTGSSPLCFRGKMWYKTGLTWLSSFLDVYWERIRILDISFGFFSSEEIFNDRQSFTRPAPLLEVFKFNHLPSKLLNSDAAQTLFSNSAHNLREFACLPLRFNLRQAMWARSLRAITISSTITLLATLEGLSQIPNLQSLTVNGVCREGSSSSSSIIMEPVGMRHPNTPIVFSRLHFMEIKNDDDELFRSQQLLLESTSFFSILESITLPPNCSIALDGLDFPSQEVGSEEVTRLCEAVYQHSEKCLRATNPRRLSIHTTDQEAKLVISIELIPQRSRRAIYPETSIVFLSMQRSWKFKSGVASAILQAVSGGFNPSLITSLHLILSTKVLQNADYIHFASSLPAVERLEVTKDALNFLHRYSAENSIVIFPLLERVGLSWYQPKYRYRSISQPYWEDIHNAVIPFLQLRKASSCRTLEVLDLKQWASFWTDWTAFDQFVGMNVIGKLVLGGYLNYVCGVGNDHPRLERFVIPIGTPC